MRRLLAPLLAALLASCASAGPSTPPIAFAPTPQAYAAVDVSTMRVYEDVREADLPAPPLRIAHARQPRGSKDNGALILALRDAAAARGANAILRLWDAEGAEYVAVRLDSAGLAAADRFVLNRAGGGATAGTPAGSSATPGEDVQVRGYCRKDGVCVRPHTRSRPGSGRSRRP